MTEKNLPGYDFSSKKQSIKEIFDTPEYREYKTKKVKTQKNKEQLYKFTSIGGSTDAVKYLIIANVLIFIFSWYIIPSLINIGAVYNISDPNFKIWQPLTSMLLHGGWLHLIFNMFALWSIANSIDQTIGAKKLLQLYFISGLSSSILCMLFSMSPAVGASGAICGLLSAMTILYPDSKVLLFFFIPVKIRHAVYGFAAFSLFFGILSIINSSLGFGIAHFGHLGGLIAGFLLMYYWKNKKINQ